MHGANNKGLLILKLCIINGVNVMKKYSLDALREQGLVKVVDCQRSDSRTGYGSKIPTPCMVFIDNKWRRVYCRIYSNVGTCYVLIKGERVIID